MDNEVKISADWGYANSVGRQQALSVIQRMIREQNPTLLGRELKRLVLKGEFGGVEVGFAHAIAEQLLRANDEVCCV